MVHPRIRIVHALQDVNLRIQRGEIVAYAGPNARARSTTVKLLSAMLSPDRGTVRVLGMDPVRDRVRTSTTSARFASAPSSERPPVRPASSGNA